MLGLCELCCQIRPLEHLGQLGEQGRRAEELNRFVFDRALEQPDRVLCHISHAESTIRVAGAEPSPLPKSNAAAGLAQVVVAKYADHIPLHRQEAIFGRHGVAIPGQTLCEWALGAAELLAALMPGLRAHVLAAPRVHCDDTVLPGRAKTRSARL